MLLSMPRCTAPSLLPKTVLWPATRRRTLWWHRCLPRTDSDWPPSGHLPLGLTVFQLITAFDQLTESRGQLRHHVGVGAARRSKASIPDSTMQTKRNTSPGVNEFVAVRR